jgi:UDP-2,3-diacylglucosamine pyrophosphatase LpxH
LCIEFRDTIYAVSDVHLASKFFYDPIQKEKFWQFLDELGNNPRTRELILNGDIIETWSSPIEVRETERKPKEGCQERKGEET